jgi:hypothetical protein
MDTSRGAKRQVLRSVGDGLGGSEQPAPLPWQLVSAYATGQSELITPAQPCHILRFRCNLPIEPWSSRGGSGGVKSGTEWRFC